MDDSWYDKLTPNQKEFYKHKWGDVYTGPIPWDKLPKRLVKEYKEWQKFADSEEYRNRDEPMPKGFRRIL